MRPFLTKEETLAVYLALDDSMMNTYFQSWMPSSVVILSDLASHFIIRKVFKSVTFDEKAEALLDGLRKYVAQVGFVPNYYTGIHINFDLPYDI